MKIWRNGKQEKIFFLKAVLMYVWLIPAIPIGVYGFAYYIDARGNKGGSKSDYVLTSILNIEPTFTVLALSAIGFVLWIWSVKALTTPTFIISEDKLTLYSYGFLPDHLTLASLAEIRTYNLGPIGTLIDFKSKVGSNFREFAFLATVKKDVLQAALGDRGIKVI